MLASVCSYRPGSVIVDFVVRTSQVIPDEMAQANKNFTEAMTSIIPVIGEPTAVFISKFQKSEPAFTTFCLLD